MSYESPAKVPSTRENNFMRPAPRLVSRRCHIRDFDMFIPLGIKAGFHMIADDRRRSQTIADDRGSQIVDRIVDDGKESCFHIIADDRERSQSRVLPTFRSAEACFHMIADDRRTHYLRSAIRDRLQSYGSHPLEHPTGFVAWQVFFSHPPQPFYFLCIIGDTL